MWRSQEEVGLSENQGMSSSPRMVEAEIGGQNLWIGFVCPGKAKKKKLQITNHTQRDTHIQILCDYLLSFINILAKQISALLQKKDQIK